MKVLIEPKPDWYQASLRLTPCEMSDWLCATRHLSRQSPGEVLKRWRNRRETYSRL